MFLDSKTAPPGGEPMYRMCKERLAFMKAGVEVMEIDAVTCNQAAAVVRLNEPFTYYMGLLEAFDWSYLHQKLLDEQNLMQSGEMLPYQLLAMIGRVIEIIEGMPEFAELAEKY